MKAKWVFSLVFFYTSYFLFPWKKAAPEQKKFQKAKRCLLCSWLSKRKIHRYFKKNSLTVVWILIKETSHPDLMQCFKSTYQLWINNWKRGFMLPSNKITLGKKYQTFVPFYFINLKNTQYSLSNLSASNIYIYILTQVQSCML